MASHELTDTTALVTGASRGFGRAVAVALRDAGANVVAVARSTERLGKLRDQRGGSLATVAADVADPVVAGSLLEQYRPKTLVLNAGAAPVMRPIQHHVGHVQPQLGGGRATDISLAPRGAAPPPRAA